MYQNYKNKNLNFLKKIWNKIKPRFSFHYVAYSILFFVVAFMIVNFVSATTPNPGHPWSELGDGVFSVTNNQTANRTYTFPDANATILTTNAAVTVAQGGTNLTSIADKSILITTAANTVGNLVLSAGESIRRNVGDTAFEAFTPLSSLSGAALLDQTTPQTIGNTTNRLAKLWATDLTVTNPIAGSVTGNAGSVTNATLTTALTVNTGTVGLVGNVANSSVLTLGAGASSISGTNTGDNAANSNYASDYRAANFVAGTDYLTPTGSAASLTSFPTFNQNTTGTAAGLSAQYIDWNSASGGNSIANKPTLGTWSTINYPTWSSGTPFVKMTAAGTFALDTNTYLTSLSGAAILAGQAGGQTLNGGTLTTQNLTLRANATDTTTGSVAITTSTASTTTATGALTVAGGVGVTGRVSAGNFNGLTITANGTNTLNIAAGQTLTATTSLTNNGGAGTLTWPAAGAILTIPTGGGTLGSAAFTNSTAYQASSSALTSVAGLSWSSGTPFVKMTAAGTFSLDTNTYLTSLSGAAILAGQAGGQTLNGGTLTTQNLTLRANATDTTTGSVAITTSTASTTTATGALTVAGGVGVTGRVSAGNFNGLTITANGTNTLNIAAGQTLTATTSLTNNGGAGTLTWPAAGAILTIPTGGGTLGTAAFTASTAYAILAGQAGGQTLQGGTLTAQNLTLRSNAADLTTGAVIFSDTKDASSITVGSVQMAGGLAVAKRIYALDMTVTNAISGSVTGSAGSASKATNLTGGNNTTLLGSLPYQSALDTTTLLSPNTSATKMYLSMTGTGTNGAAPVWSTITGGGDMVLASAQTNSGAKTFLSGTMLLRNVANTFNGSFTNTNTADRIYTLPNYDGTLSTLAGNEALTNKSVNGVTLSTSAGATNYLAGDGTYKAVSGGGSLQTAYGLGASIETSAGTPVTITETTTVASTHNLLGLTVNPATTGTFTGDALNIVMDAVDLGANTGNGLHIVVDQSQATGFPILVEDDAGVDILSLSQTGGLTIGSATNRLATTTYGDFISKGSDIQTALTGIIDITVYDSSRDSDGGEWRNNLLSQQLSWYGESKDDGVNDPCNISTDDRCGISEFPRKAILVTTANGLYIFNASNNLLWMKFTQAGTYALGASTNNNLTGIDAQNGVIVVGTNGSAATGMYAIDFKQDAMYRYNSTDRSQGDKNIGNRNTTVTYNLNSETNFRILDNFANDVSIAMQTSSNEGAAGTLIAPADSQSGPVRGTTLIAVATDTGVSVIDMGARRVLSYSDATGNDYNQVYLTSRGRMYATNETLGQLEGWRNLDKNVISELNGTPDSYFDETVGRGKISLNGVVPTMSTSPGALSVIERGSSARESSAAGQVDSGDIVYVGTNQGLAEIHTSGGLIPLAAWSKVTTKDVTTPYMVGTVRAAYLFNEAAGSTAATSEVSANTINRMQSPIVGTAPTFGQSGVRGDSVNFNNNSYLCSDSTNDGVCDGNINFNAGTVSFTISLWFKHGTTAANDTLFERCYTPATPTAAVGCIYAGMTTTGAIRFGIDSLTTWTYATTYDDSILSSALYNDNQWHHAVFTNTDTDICMYIDGRQAVACDTAIAATATMDAAQVLTLGGSCAGANCVTGANFWDGSIDDFVWSSNGTTTTSGLTAQSANKLYLDGRAHLIRPVSDVTNATTFSSTTIGDSGESYIPGSFVGLILELTGGTGAGQTRTIIANDATTFTVYPAFTVTPDATTDYSVNAGRLYGATNNVTSISPDLPTSLNRIRKIYVGTNDGADGGGISVFTNAGAGSIKTEVIHSDAGYSSDDYGNSWSGTGADNITAIGSYSDTAVFGNGAFFRSQRKDISLKQLQTDTIAALEDMRIEMVAKGLFGSTQDVLGLGQGADLAEYYYSNTPLEAGDVVAIQPDQPAGIGKSDSRYQKNLLGVVSTRPGLTLGPVAENAYPIALGGRIPVKITNENGEIHVGDMLTSSSKDGYAMKATTAGQVLGRVINEPEVMTSCNATVLPTIGEAVGDGPGVTGITDVTSTDSGDGNDEEITGDEMTIEDEEEIKTEDKGNQINDDDLKCGYAMLFVGLSDSLGSDVVKLAEEYATAKGLNNLIEEDEEGLEIDVISEDLEEEGEEIDERRFILDFLQAEKKARLENGFDLQSIYTDRLAAAIEIITPSVVTDDLYVGNVAEFALPPLFNKDTAGFAMIKKGDRRVRIDFENPYIAEPAVGAMMVFNTSDDFTDTEANNIFDNKIESMVVDSDQNGFTILINKDAPRDLRYAWNAFAVKDVKVFESVIEGLTIEMNTGEESIDNIDEENNISDSDEVVAEGGEENNGENTTGELIGGTPSIDKILNTSDAPIIIEEKKEEIVKKEVESNSDNSQTSTLSEQKEVISAKDEESITSADPLTY